MGYLMIFRELYVLQNEVFFMSYVYFMISSQTTPYKHRVTLRSK